MLGQVFARFMEKSPVSVMVRGMLERALNRETLDAWYDEVSDKQYTRTLLFSTLYDLLSQVVFKIKPSVHAAYQEQEEEVGVSVVAVYNKLKGVEVQTSAELVRFSVGQLAPLVSALGGECAAWVPGYRVKILDGNCLEATEHRLKELREVAGGPLPGKSLVVYEPALGMVVDVFPCEDGHAQERALLPLVLPTIQAGELWIQDRNFCVRDFLCGTQERGACFLTREHQGLAWEAVTPLRPSPDGPGGRAMDRAGGCQWAAPAVSAHRSALKAAHPGRGPRHRPHYQSAPESGPGQAGGGAVSAAVDD